ncbi:hypothetical protein [Wenxinia saemankumensis]|uniref:Uncharacterized protein n=1 Tax=Wenxinia saemankumensis TaxID=1447782 RepID=A0A1M6ED55_9RHOB|nr:hypothetical protein [Wenxinia saemankumensis]SHI83416.1 hypothetical protein SAMN05444417_1944 [Wenxinia saemankumensis]
MMSRLAAAALVAVQIAALPQGAAAQSHQAPDSLYSGQWFTTPDGCSYSRAQAPGYLPTWHLIVNPHHIGQPAPHRGCPAMPRSAR